MNARSRHPSARSHGAAAPPAPGVTAGSAVLAGRACCCAARAAVQVTMPPTPARPHETDLLLCGHHYRVSRCALEAARAAVRELPGTPDDVAAWIDVHRPAALAGRWREVHARVKDVMTTRVIAARADASYADLAAMLREHRVSGFPVVDGEGIVVGVVSESDLLARQEARRPRRKRARLAELTAADLMSWPPATIGPEETVRHAARLMYAHRLRRLPVVDQRGRLVGLVCRADLLSAFTRPDDEIRREITQDVIADGFFTDPDRFVVTVKDGIVTLAGAPGSVILGRNIADQARHVAGVIAVRDRFTYPAPAARSASPVPSDPGL